MSLILPDQLGDGPPILGCDRCGCIILVALIAAHERCCPGRQP